ncbi:MAG: 5'/3'-nucleotidase SurE, partial [Acidimicrobiia bacterium]
MRILVTNDDGLDAPGIVALARALALAGHEIVVVAPTSDRSGSSAAIGPLHR